MSNYQNIKSLITAFSGQEKILTIPKIYIELTGDLNTALILNQIVFWSDKTKRKDGFFYKTYIEWEEETTLSQYQTKRSVDKLKKMGIVQTELKRANGSPTLHYKLNYEVLQKSIIKKLNNRKSSSLINHDKETSQSLTDDYTDDNNRLYNNSSVGTEPSIPYKKIIDYLNEKADRSFSHVAESNKKLIRARWNELKKTHPEMDVEELLSCFEKVIDNKVADANDPSHFFTEEYLRPSTLFRGSNFDKYLNQVPKKEDNRGYDKSEYNDLF